ncbi:MAG: DUF2442 domain-containing protein, partial [Bacteroidota bacterium]|nr:DUF2442 domain-containing protein [Bacteroidota bacterium]
MYLAVKDVKPQSDYLLLLTFENGEKRQFDVKPYLHIGIFQELKDESLFKTVRKSFDTIEWANAADFDPEFLYEKSQK